MLDRWGNQRAAFEAGATIDRHEWDLTWNPALDSGILRLSRRIDLDVHVEFVREVRVLVTEEENVTTTAADELRRAALALPEVEESTHFGLPSFKVRGKNFATLQQGDTHAIVHVDRETADDAVLRSPRSLEAVSRNDGRIFVGLRVDLAAAAPADVAALVRLAWRHRAPKRLVAAYDG